MGRHTNLTAADEQRIQTLFKEGHGAVTISRMIGIPKGSVRRALERAGLGSHGGAWVRPRALELEKHGATIKAEYEAGATFQSLIAKYGTTLHLLDNLFTKLGIEKRTQWDRSKRANPLLRLSEEEKAQLATTYLGGVTLEAMSQRAGVAVNTMRKFLKERGVTIRSVGVPRAGRDPRDAVLQRKYGIGVAEYAEMLAAQGGVCAICKVPPTDLRNNKNRTLNVDHCHSSMGVRGLLCHMCNLALGHMLDNAEWLDVMSAYVRADRGPECADDLEAAG